MIRHPFELYQDQVEALRQLAANDRMRGGAGSMSAMVRDAIDRLIDEQSNPLTKFLFLPNPYAPSVPYPRTA